MVVYETFIVDQVQFGKPRNPDHLLRRNELLDMFCDFRCLRYREGIIDGKRAIASILAEKLTRAGLRHRKTGRKETFMSIMELVQRRYSVRAYRPDPVEEDKLNYVLEAARLAPTAGNRQPLRLIVIHTVGKEAELRVVYNRDWFVQAPTLICACAVPSEAWVRCDGKNYSDVDVAIAMDHLVLAAAEQGLGTCWVAAFDPVAAKSLLHLPEGIEPIVFTPLGYPMDTPKPKKRKTLAELCDTSGTGAVQPK